MNRRQGFRAAALGTVLAVALVACADGTTTTGADTGDTTAETTTPTTVAAAEPTRVEIVASEFAFSMPDEIPAGVVEVTMHNDGSQVHHAQLARLNEGVTLEQFQAALQQGETAAFPLITFVGGPGPMPHAGDQTVTLELEPGQYLALCFIPDPADGAPHLAKGMIRPFVVTDEPVSAAAPEPEGTIELADFAIALPDGFDGTGTFAVANTGTQPHEIGLGRLADGKTLDDVFAWFAAPAGPPPYTDAGGFQGIAGGATGYVDLDLEAGDYFGICFIPDPVSGKAHVELGMVSPFSVS